MSCLPRNAPDAVVFPDDNALRLGPNRVTILRDSFGAGGPLRLFERHGSGMVAFDLAPNHSVSRHLQWHTREDCSGTVLDGRIEMRFAGRREVLGRGGTLLVPARCPFAWRNPDATAARIVFTYTPGGFEHYYRECAAVIAAQSCGKQMARRLKALAEKYGIERER